MKFRPSSTTKESGVPWLGMVPTDWSVVQSRRLFKERNQKSNPGELQLTASQKHGIIPQSDFMKLEGRRVVQVQKGHEILKHVEAGDFVMSMRSFQGGLEYSTLSGSVSSAYVPLATLKWVFPGYFKYLFKSSTYIQALQSTSDLVRDGQALRFENFSKVALPIVPSDEQKFIADYLDRTTAHIDALVNKKTRLIELLRERFIALASKAEVDSAANWIRLSHASEVINRPVVQEAGNNYTKLGLYNRGRGIFKKEPTDTENMGDSDFHWVKAGDLILSGQFAWEGAAARAKTEHDDCVVSHRYHLLRGRKGVALTDYLYAYFLTRHGDFVLNDSSRGSAGRNRPLNLNLLLNWKIPIPPPEIQEEIASLIRAKEKMESLQRRSISLLQEHRTALITAAVTGKIDLRDAA